MKIEEAIQQKKFDSHLHKAIVNVMYTNNWLLDKQQVAFRQFDITPQQYNVLRILRGRYPGAAKPGEIKSVMLDKNPDLTRLCDRLEKKRLVRREVNPSNKRQVHVYITPSGLDLLEKIDPHVNAASQRITLSEKDAAMLSDLLDKLRGSESAG